MTRTLFDQPPAQRHSHTSVEAAEMAKATKAKDEMLVFSVLREAGEYGATDEEIRAALPDMKESTQRARRVGLMHKRMVEGSLKKRKTESGRWATVWVATGERR